MYTEILIKFSLKVIKLIFYFSASLLKFNG